VTPQLADAWGHGSPTITLAVYGHLFGNTDVRTAEIMEATFAGLRTDWARRIYFWLANR